MCIQNGMGHAFNRESISFLTFPFTEKKKVKKKKVNTHYIRRVHLLEVIFQEQVDVRTSLSSSTFLICFLLIIKETHPFMFLIIT